MLHDFVNKLWATFTQNALTNGRKTISRIQVGSKLWLSSPVSERKPPERSKENMSYHIECYLISYCFERINLMLFLPALWSLIDFQRSLFDLFPSQGNIAFRALWRASNNVVIPTKMATRIGKHGINIIYGRFLVADHLICRYLIETIFHVNVARLPLIWSPAHIMSVSLHSESTEIYISFISFQYPHIEYVCWVHIKKVIVYIYKYKQAIQIISK